jgi:hypothetical protein
MVKALGVIQMPPSAITATDGKSQSELFAKSLSEFLDQQTWLTAPLRLFVLPEMAHCSKKSATFQ